MTIRPLEKKDLSALKTVLNSIDLFPAAYLEPMTADYFDNSETEAIWLVVLEEDLPIGLAYCLPEQFAAGTYNLLSIGVHSDRQGRGAGRQLIQQLEDQLRQAKQRLLIIDTSSNLPANLVFYKKCGYTQEAIIRDFWADGDDKVTFWKRLS